MPCDYPVQAIYSLRADGKKDMSFSNANARAFVSGRKPLGDSNMSLPCGRCMSCRIERSRQFAVRCVHESKCYQDSCFVTLTYSPENLVKLCPGGSLVRKHVQDFMKRLRFAFVPPYPMVKGVSLVDQTKKEWISEFGIRVYGCGEYGEVCANCGLSLCGKPRCVCVSYVKDLGRPHFHLCLFNFDFPDRVRFKRVGDYWYYTSDILSSLWEFGFSTVCDFSFETAAYVARYCTKKINGDMAKSHYRGRKPEFPVNSNRPGIGAPWYYKYAETDVWPHDSVISRGHSAKCPRYYDILWDRYDPEGFAKAKEARRVMAEDNPNSTFKQLAIRRKVIDSKLSTLVRAMERGE